MTPGERKALLFLAAVGVLGAGARVASSPSRAPSREERLALQGQIAAVDSARGAPPNHRARRPRPSRGDRVASVPREASVRGARATPPVDAAPADAGPVDVDAADAAAIETLPGIGPALAARIVADRAAHGAFGSVAGLQRVRGVGPRLAARVAPHVTFSGAPRLPDAAVVRPP